MRTGANYVAALRDGRAVYLDGERVKDVTTHPAFAEPPVVNARLFKSYDWQAAKALVDRCLGEY